METIDRPTVTESHQSSTFYGAGRLELRRQSIRLAIGSPAAIAQCGDPAFIVPAENLVAGLPRDPKLVSSAPAV